MHMNANDFGYSAVNLDLTSLVYESCTLVWMSAGGLAKDNVLTKLVDLWLLRHHKTI